MVVLVAEEGVVVKILLVVERVAVPLLILVQTV